MFEGDTWNKYEELRTKNKILKEMQRSDPTQGIGKPEPLKHKLSGFWSRRLAQKDRLIYKFDNQSIYIFAIGDLYESL